MERKLFYFGCIGQAGHFLWQNQDYQYYARQMARTIPGLNPRVLECLDGIFTPGMINEHEGVYQESMGVNERAAV